MLIAEESFDALLGLLIDAGVVTSKDTALMLARLADRLKAHGTGEIVSEWCVDDAELKHAAIRFSAMSELLRACSDAPRGF